MLEVWSLVLISTAYVAVLFAIAAHGDRRALAGGRGVAKPWIYSLALGVYATSWTFHGAVGRAVEGGWAYLPIYLGPMLVFLLAGGWLERLVRLSRRHNITSIADFIGARYGRNQGLAALVTVVAVVGVLPYIALQFKAVAFGFEILAAPTTAGGGRVLDGPLLIAVLLAVFTILFGTRQVVTSENHHGLMQAIAFESVVKLLAFITVGLYAMSQVEAGLLTLHHEAIVRLRTLDAGLAGSWQAGFLAQTLLAATAVFCLPRQFHVTVVENASIHDLRRARWLFPLYLAAISLLVPPIAAAGLARLPQASGDTYMLALPLADGHPWLAMAAYLGGFSAATSMVIVACIALSTMISNELVLPALIGARWLRLSERRDLGGLVKNIRRAAIVAIVAASYAYYRLFTGPGSLAEIGLLSFAAVAQFAPAIVGGVLGRGGSYAGALAGLVAGFALWVYTLLLPALLKAAGAGQPLLDDGPLGIGWLRPQALFGLDGLGDLTHGTLWSLGINLLVYLLVPLLAKPGLRERLHAGRFLELPDADEPARAMTQGRSGAMVGDLQALLERFFGPERARIEVESQFAGPGRMLPVTTDRATPELARHVERLLAGALGAASARLVLAAALKGRDMQLEDVINLLDETAHQRQFSREMLRASLEHLSQGVSVVDRDLRLVAWNRRYVELFDYPDGLITVGRPIAEVFRCNAERGLLGDGDPEAAVERRLVHLRAGSEHRHERELPDGRVIEVVGNPMSGGGFVTSFSDITEYKRAQRVLENVNVELEQRVAERTRAADDARRLAERADRAKSRFLASVTHDLVQPLNAARLFVSSLDREAIPADAARIVGQAEGSLQAAENLIAALLDISRLDAAAQVVRRAHLPLARVLDPLAAEFAALAAARGLEFRYRPSRALVETDPALLRRVLQNFLANALRYTRAGCIVFGVRRRAAGIEIVVLDSGPGIAPERQTEIFEEFRRLENGTGFDQGLGLGLSIAERLSRLLDHPLRLRSVPGRGSAFSIRVPKGRAEAVEQPAPPPPVTAGDDLRGLTVFCLDNERATLTALSALLGRWGCTVVTADSADAALELAATTPAPDVALIDFHLGAGPDGISTMAAAAMLWGQAVPAIVITADPTEDARLAAEAAGHARLTKPVRPAALRALVSRIAQARTAARAEARSAAPDAQASASGSGPAAS